MSDLIDRDEAIKRIDRQRVVDKSVVKRLLYTMSTAQPEQKIGKWIEGKCSECGDHAPFWSMASTYYESKFCPNCGAKME